MKEILKHVFLLIGIALWSSAQAQLIMDLNTSGTVFNDARINTQAISGTIYYSFQFHHAYKSYGWTSNTDLERRGVLEFNLTTVDGNSQLPTASMNSWNWSAWIDGMFVESVINSGMDFRLDVYNLSDDAEDGVVDISDYIGSQEMIERVFSTTPSEGTLLNPIDVTAALRHDLFGLGQGDLSSGFVLIPSRGFSNGHSAVRFDRYKPRLIVNVFSPTPLPTQTPPPTQTPLPTSTPCDIVLEIEMPSNSFYPNDLCWVDLWITNVTEDVFWKTPVFVVLDLYGSYYFAPSFTDFDYYSWNAFPGRWRLSILDVFTWPEGVGVAEDVCWWAAATDSEFSILLSEMHSLTFNWYPE